MSLAVKVLIVVLSFGSISSKLALRNSLTLIDSILNTVLPYCKVNIIHVFSSATDSYWLESYNELVKISSDPAYYKTSSGAVNYVISPNATNNNNYVGIARNKSRHSINACYANIIMVPSGLDAQTELMLTELLTKPLLNPPTVKNADKYIIITKEIHFSSIEKSRLVRKLKYKIVLTEDDKNVLKTFNLCPHLNCPLGSTLELDTKILSTSVHFYFPDFQKNYHGSLQRISASRKISSLMESEKNETTGKYYATRGSHAFTLFHLMKKLNFTSEVVPSWKGNTGQLLSNGSWIGVVGDVIGEKVDWSYCNAMDYTRYSVIEQCSQITTEAWGFAVGPPMPIYTWKAMFWPFTTDLWLCTLAATTITSAVGYFLVKYGSDRHHRENEKWKLGKITQYFMKTFLGEADDIPTCLPESMKILIGFWLLFVMVASTAYTSKLVTLMTFPVYDKIPDDFYELVNSDYGITLNSFGSVSDSSLKASKDPTFVKLVAKMEKEPDALKCLLKTATSKYVCFTYKAFFNDLKYRNISDRFGQTPIKLSQNYGFTFGVGLAHEMKAAMSPNFKWIIVSAIEMGLVDHWQKVHDQGVLKRKNDWERDVGKVQVSAYDDADNLLHLHHLIGAFCILCAGFIIAIPTFILEKLKQKYYLR